MLNLRSDAISLAEIFFDIPHQGAAIASFAARKSAPADQDTSFGVICSNSNWSGGQKHAGPLGVEVQSC